MKKVYRISNRAQVILLRDGVELLARVAEAVRKMPSVADKVWPKASYS
ncbi:hypothetical protein M5W83_03035 [Paenibacillus thiaminolyticus]|uniref:Uncharacterized protein n=1 Tax=Paenibacillus thiaminolyticus TaxID=49283 RepID=A0ABT4FTK0_PANTH|nr:hypothetical protein [Paenibacillus thiaminolyticus]MCY9535223.1 hypothetical protein [Paenibacillus thiaminolyticus]MCY9602484.1 hypothetical protein [Paenibacillus thiaminolyticus]MCY9606136.1 hypothetical protein [Paenibacillus thiaminolyticus]MCY9612521.1 hypothetical protein [Paenibacillus thiaminolyticus]MCY9620850.1 hypothetical protein [Paenibacillus thiaminolyticus]